MTSQRLAPFDPLRALETLHRHGVRFVVIGAFAGRLLGSPSLTRDLDICYARDRTNLEALATALLELHARLRGVAEEVPLRLDAKTLANGDSFTFVTDAGDLDVLGTPSGTAGYDELARTANEVDLGGMRIQIASIDSLIRMKRAAGRPKDLIEVEVLGALRDEIDRGTGG
jgi:predicted nucleotidyltransferase